MCTVEAYSLAFSPVSKPHTHIIYMLRQCTNIVSSCFMQIKTFFLMTSVKYFHHDIQYHPNGQKLWLFVCLFVYLLGLFFLFSPFFVCPSLIRSTYLHFQFLKSQISDFIRVTISVVISGLILALLDQQSMWDIVITFNPSLSSASVSFSTL